MFVVLVALSLLVSCSRAKPDANATNALRVNITKAAGFSSEDSKCPDEYFDSGEEVTVRFKRGTKAKTKKETSGNLDQIQCGSLPDIVDCDFKDIRSPCKSPGQWMPEAPRNLDFTCEMSTEKPWCALKDSCILKCGSGTCPDGYFNPTEVSGDLRFKRGTNAKRKDTPLSNQDQVQCGSSPDVLDCKWEDPGSAPQGIFVCKAPGQWRHQYNASLELDCETSKEDPWCVLADSCILRCESGLSTGAIIGIVVAVLVVVGVAGGVIILAVKRRRST